MWNPFDFNVDQGMTPQQLAYKRALNANAGAGLGDANYGGAGMAQLLTGLKLGYQNKQLDGVEAQGRQSADAAMSAVQPMSILGFPQPQQGQGITPAPVDPNSPQGIATDTMKAIGKMPDFGAVESQYGLPSGYLQEVAQIESGMNPNAQNPNSSAGGLFQFIDSTAGQYGLTDKMDPFAATDAAARLAADNAKALRAALGREPTKGELYLAHQQGAGGAVSLLTNPNANAASIVGADAVNLNGGNSNMTAAEFANKWVSKLSGNSPQAYAQAIPVDALMEAMQNPWTTPEQRQVLEMMLSQQQQNADPMQALGIQKAQQDLQIGQMEIDAAGQPQPQQLPAAFQALDLQAQAAGFAPGTPEYQDFMRNGGGSGTPAAFTALDLQAQAAGLVPGSPEYQTFMATRGAGLQAEAKAKGEALAAAEIAAPADVATADRTMMYIEEIRNHPGLDAGTGASSVFNIVPGMSGRDFQNRVDQVTAGAFLTAIDEMRGMGALSNAEGATATAAITRMNTSTSKEEFLAALADYQTVVEIGRERALKRVMAPGAATPANGGAAAPATGAADMIFDPATGEFVPAGGGQ